MELVSLEYFKSWAGTVRLEAGRVDLGEGRTENTLRFRAPEPTFRYWSTPFERKSQMRMLVALLEAQGEWEACWVLKREGAWSDLDEHEGYDELLHLLEIPFGFEGAIRIERRERAALVLLILMQIDFGWCGYYDLLVVPDHGRTVIQTDDDGVITVYSPDPAAMAQVIQRLHAVGFELPKVPPGEGFHWQPWMEQATARDKE